MIDVAVSSTKAVILGIERIEFEAEEHEMKTHAEEVAAFADQTMEYESVDDIILRN